MGKAVTATCFSGLTEAQRQDAEHFDAHWREMVEHGQIELVVPPDEEMWRRDLGRSLGVTFEWLGDLRGKRVLELGCGPGDYTIIMARRGADVTALDIAPSSLHITRERAEASGVGGAVHVSWMAAETLAFRAATFDWVVGFGLLHHADLTALGPELVRVLRSDGRALFREPLGTNPVLEFARNHLPYRDKHHSRNEHPLKYDHIHQVGRGFRSTRVREFYLFSMISRAIGGEMSFPALWSLDEWLIRRVPLTRRWCRYVLVEYAV
jgi:ubiquinone/menaquinone biosynthesis C-methylase UbiE